MSDNSTKWRVVVATVWGYKLTYIVGDEQMAHEHARMAIQRGIWLDDERGVRTYYPASTVDKAKVVPPGVQLDKTEMAISSIIPSKDANGDSCHPPQAEPLGQRYDSAGWMDGGPPPKHLYRRR